MSYTNSTSYQPRCKYTTLILLLLYPADKELKDFFVHHCVELTPEDEWIKMDKTNQICCGDTCLKCFILKKLGLIEMQEPTNSNRYINCIHLLLERR